MPDRLTPSMHNELSEFCLQQRIPIEQFETL